MIIISSLKYNFFLSQLELYFLHEYNASFFYKNYYFVIFSVFLFFFFIHLYIKKCIKQSVNKVFFCGFHSHPSTFFKKLAFFLIKSIFNAKQKSFVFFQERKLICITVNKFWFYFRIHYFLLTIQAIIAGKHIANGTNKGIISNTFSTKQFHSKNNCGQRAICYPTK